MHLKHHAHTKKEHCDDCIKFENLAFHEPSAPDNPESEILQDLDLFNPHTAPTPPKSENLNLESPANLKNDTKKLLKL